MKHSYIKVTNHSYRMQDILGSNSIRTVFGDYYLVPAEHIDNAEIIYQDIHGLWGNTNDASCDYQAILLNPQPIKQETCAEVLREFLEQYDDGRVLTQRKKTMVEKAKAALEREGKS